MQWSRLKARDVEPDQEAGALRDLRVQSLKVLALTLVRELELLDQHATNGTTRFDLNAEVRRFENALIKSALVQTGGRQRRAANLLGMNVATLNRKIKQYAITTDELE